MTPPWRSFRRSLLCLALACTATPAWAGNDEGESWLSSLQEDTRADIAAGKPVVVQVHVPLCDNSIITCGGRGLGDGEDLRRNLYWATAEGLVGWMNRKGSGWSQVRQMVGPAFGEPQLLEARVWRRALPLPRAWKAPGMPTSFTAYVVGFAWRGTAIDRALTTYLSDLFFEKPRAIPLSDGEELLAGGAARLIAWVGHNRMMDVSVDWNVYVHAGETARFRKGALAVACYSAEYLRKAVPAPTRVPLLMTTNFVMASSAAMEGSVMAFLGGQDLVGIRMAGATGYATGQRRPVERVRSAFTNPSDQRWPKAP